MEAFSNNEISEMSAGPLEPAVIPTRNITPAQMDPDALKVVRRLHRFGHTAYLVGGCVRDLLLKRIPKDFDVATSAQPQQLRKLFRNCRMIGRRFRLAHIHFREKVIETATFRAAQSEPPEIPDRSGEDLLIRSDNVFGTEEEDACRRDLTINALFYDPIGRQLIDYFGGLEDLVSRTVRFIGDPEIRVREDPVRILRAIRFAASLGFSIEKTSWRAIVSYRRDLTKSAPARVFEEIHRMLREGHSEGCLRLLWEAAALEVILPEVGVYLARSPDRGEERDPGAGLWAYLRGVDGWKGQPLSDPVLLAAVMVHPIMDAVRHGRGSYGIRAPSGSIGEVALEMLRAMVERIRLPKWKAERIQQLVVSHKKLLALGRQETLPRSWLRRACFPEALDLLRIGAEATGNGKAALSGLCKTSNPTPLVDRPAPLEHAPGDRGRRRQRRRRRPRRQPVPPR